jgi:hypothetical protein
MRCSTHFLVSREARERSADIKGDKQEAALSGKAETMTEVSRQQMKINEVHHSQPGNSKREVTRQ